MSGDSTHTMDDGEIMKDSEMHMEMMHDWDDIKNHDADTHGDHE
jgi:predicted small metal-binding protein